MRSQWLLEDYQTFSFLMLVFKWLCDNGLFWVPSSAIFESYSRWQDAFNNWRSGSCHWKSNMRLVTSCWNTSTYIISSRRAESSKSSNYYIQRYYYFIRTLREETPVLITERTSSHTQRNIHDLHNMQDNKQSHSFQRI